MILFRHIWIGVCLVPVVVLAQSANPGAGEVMPAVSEKAASPAATTAKEADANQEEAASSTTASPAGEPMQSPAADEDGETGEEEAAQVTNATEVVTRLNQALLEAMRKGKQLGYQGRYHLLAPVIRQVYDFDAIAKYVLGQHWDKLTDQQKQAFIRKLTDYGIAAYASQFNEYSGEQFTILSEEPFRGRFRVVKSILQVPDDEDVNFVYILRRSQEGWKIMDVRYDGVSDLALKRGQFTQILDKEGFEQLLAKLDEKIANYAKEKPANG